MEPALAKKLTGEIGIVGTNRSAMERHNGEETSLYAKRLDRGKFVWPLAQEGVVSISAGQMAYMLEGIVWTPSAGQVRSWLWTDKSDAGLCPAY
jgi:transposase